MFTANQTNQTDGSRQIEGSALSSNTRIRCSPLKSKPSTDSRTLGQKQLILNKMPAIDPNTLHGSAVSELNSLLKVTKTIEQMAPSPATQGMLVWVLEQLRHFFMFNSRLVHQKVMMKSNASKTKAEQFVFLEPISRSQQMQFEAFLEAFNLYFREKLERNNVLIEVNCAF